MDTLREDQISERNSYIASCGILSVSPDTGDCFWLIQRSDGSEIEIPLQNMSIMQIETCALCDGDSTSFDDIEIINDNGNAIVHYDCVTNNGCLTIVPYGSKKEA